MAIQTVYASSVAALDSNVFTGGGTNVTKELQAVLDRAKTEGGVHLVMDGAALVSGLTVYSNTTIECLTKDCGFYLDDNSNCAVIINGNPSKTKIRTRCVSLLGGTYNQNASHQVHHTEPSCPEINHGIGENVHMVMVFEFYGVEYLTIKDVTIRNQRAWAAVICNWRHVVVENVDIDLPEHMDGQNQDGLHFWGPGRFLTVKNLSGRTGDDILAIAPDEFDCVSDITDVEVDGVFMDNADQGIRLLSRGTGRLDRVTIRNVTGTYKCFGFYIQPWFHDACGAYGNILIENVDLRQTEPNYHYTNPFLFRIGGNIECLTLKNIRHHYPKDSHPVAEIGVPFISRKANEELADMQKIGTVVIDGLYMLEEGAAKTDEGAIQIKGKVDNLILKDVTAICEDDTPGGTVLKIDGKKGAVKNLLLDGVYCRGYDCFADTEGKAGRVDNLGAVCTGELVK